MYDGNGLILEIRALPSKKKVWRFKYPHPISKKDRGCSRLAEVLLYENEDKSL